MSRTTSAASAVSSSSLSSKSTVDTNKNNNNDTKKANEPLPGATPIAFGTSLQLVCALACAPDMKYERSIRQQKGCIQLNNTSASNTSGIVYNTFLKKVV